MSKNILAEANNKFALKLFKVVRKSAQRQNGFLSPLSISAALAMTQIGAREKTAVEMARVLEWGSENGEKIHQEFKVYFKTLQQPSDQYQLSSANRIFLEQNFSVLEEFKSKTSEFYLAEPVPANFQKEADNERVKINSWVAEQTQNKIQDLLAPGVVDASTRMVLVNAIYFKGKWEEEFDKHSTSHLPFKLSSGETITVPTMVQEEVHGVYKDDDLNCTAVELRYKGKDLAMVIVLPHGDHSLEELVENITSEKLDKLAKEAAANRMKIQLLLPKFEITSSYMLSQTLSGLGMSDAFNQASADFSGMMGQRDLFLSEVAHKAFVQVNEEGTEAAAASGVMAVLCSLVILPTIRVDHPFLFAIIDSRASGSVLFLGQVENPKV